jgi:hypothetical protein
MDWEIERYEKELEKQMSDCDAFPWFRKYPHLMTVSHETGIYLNHFLALV